MVKKQKVKKQKALGSDIPDYMRDNPLTEEDFARFRSVLRQGARAYQAYSRDMLV